jgi:hypothetical protein
LPVPPGPAAREAPPLAVELAPAPLPAAPAPVPEPLLPLPKPLPLPTPVPASAPPNPEIAIPAGERARDPIPAPAGTPSCSPGVPESTSSWALGPPAFNPEVTRFVRSPECVAWTSGGADGGTTWVANVSHLGALMPLGTFGGAGAITSSGPRARGCIKSATLRLPTDGAGATTSTTGRTRLLWDRFRAPISGGGGTATGPASNRPICEIDRAGATGGTGNTGRWGSKAGAIARPENETRLAAGTAGGSSGSSAWATAFTTTLLRATRINCFGW